MAYRLAHFGPVDRNTLSADMSEVLPEASTPEESEGPATPRLGVPTTADYGAPKGGLDDAMHTP